MFKSLKWGVFSLAATASSLWHTLLNVGFHKNVKCTYFYSEAKSSIVLSPLKKELKGPTLRTLNSFHLNTFFSRLNTKDELAFNILIKKPFFCLTLSEIRFRKKFKAYMTKNFEIFLKNNKTIKKIIMIDEFSIPNTALTIAAKRLGRKTFALQHGVINTDDKRYAREGSYKEYKRRKDFSELVDYLIMYSDIEKKYILKDSSYFTKKNVLALGCPRYDDFKKNFTTKQKALIYRQAKINSKKQTIMWATQTHGVDSVNPQESRVTCEELFSFFVKRADEYNFIIKLHPNEDQDAPLYHEFNKKYGFIAKIIGQEVSTNDVLRITDVLLVKHSTVGAEALLLGKPIFLLELEKSFDLSIYTDNGVNFVLRKKGDLARYLSSLKTAQGKKRANQMINAFVKRRFNNFGFATKKVVSFIKKN